MKLYVKNIYIRCYVTALISFFISYSINQFFTSSVWWTIVSSILFMIVTCFIIAVIGLDNSETIKIKRLLINKIQINKHG